MLLEIFRSELGFEAGAAEFRLAHPVIDELLTQLQADFEAEQEKLNLLYEAWQHRVE